MPKISFKKNNSCTIEPIDGGDKRVHTFCKDISPKVNAIERLKFEPAYYGVVVKHVCSNSTETPHHYQMQCNALHRTSLLRWGLTPSAEDTVSLFQVLPIM